MYDVGYTREGSDEIIGDVRRLIHRERGLFGRGAAAVDDARGNADGGGTRG